MGLDMYLNAEKRLNKNSKIDRQYIDYFDTVAFDDDVDSDGLYISEYYKTKSIHDHLQTLPRLTGQVGRIDNVKKTADGYIVRTEAGYWRKANQIHNWFVENCQDGVDECQRNVVSKERIKELYELVSSFGTIPKYNEKREFIPTPAQVSLAKDQLPTTSGFFFGGTDYDQYYFLDIKDTREILKRVMKSTTINNWELSYISSW